VEVLSEKMLKRFRRPAGLAVVVIDADMTKRAPFEKQI
jgi:hypothetical protein